MPFETGATLPADLFTANVKWWITSAPPYYCQNNTSGGSSFATDAVWCGVSMWNETVGTGQSIQTTGVKYAWTYNLQGSQPTSTIKFLETLAPTWTTWQPLNKTGGPYSPEWDRPQSGEYQLGPAKLGLFFGPYDLNKTTDTTPYPQQSGDVIFIATGSDVLGGTNEGQPYSATDGRVFNLLFYSTGSNNAQQLARSLTGNASVLPDWSVMSRWSIIKDYSLFAFVALADTTNPASVMWWPISWNTTTNYYVNSINAS